MITTLDKYYTVYTTTLDQQSKRIYYVKECPINDSLYKYQKRWGFTFDSFEQCEQAIKNKIKDTGDIYIEKPSKKLRSWKQIEN